MDNITKFIDTLKAISYDVKEIEKHIIKFNKQLYKTHQSIEDPVDLEDRNVRVEKLSEVKVLVEEMHNIVGYMVTSSIHRLYGALETFHTIIDEKENEVCIVKSTQANLSASQTVDHLTDAITEYIFQHKDDQNPPKARFVDNPDNFVTEFVNAYLDHRITERMSDMVISLVTDWLSFRLPD